MYPYQLIACSFHDELEALATLRQTCEIQYRQTDGAVHMVTSKIIG
jgi:Rho-binding antiterminator